jgi:hypothetical protein
MRVRRGRVLSSEPKTRWDPNPVASWAGCYTHDIHLAVRPRDPRHAGIAQGCHPVSRSAHSDDEVAPLPLHTDLQALRGLARPTHFLEGGRDFIR